MTIHDYVAKFIQSTYKYEKTQGILARLFYMTPAQRVQRLNEIFDTNNFWEDTPAESRVHAKCRDKALANDIEKINE